MKKEEIVLKIKEIISENYEIDIDDLDENELLHESYGIDSLDRIELSLDIEDKFNIEIHDDCKTISEFADKVLKF